MTNITMNVKITIHQNTASGPVEYQEKHSVATNPYGKFNTVIGEGNISYGTILSLGSTISFLNLH